MEPTLENFEKLCKHHDWYYQYSDDHRYWTAGVKSSTALIAMRAELDNCGLAAQATMIHDTYCPWSEQNRDNND